MIRLDAQLTARLLVAHAAHAVILLAPTLLLVGPRGIGWASSLFAVGVVLAAALESWAVARGDKNELGTGSEQTKRRQTARDPAALRVAQLVGVSLLGLFWIAQIEALSTRSASLSVLVAGLVCLAAGAGLRVAAILALGDRFVSDIRVDGDVVASGIYRWLRHPSEIGLLLLATGGALAVGAPLTAAGAFVILAPISLWRMRRENLVLRAV